MEQKPQHTGPGSLTLRRHPHGDKAEIGKTIRWVAMFALLLFLTLIVVYLLTDDYRNALASGIGIIPIGISILLLRREAVALPSAVESELGTGATFKFTLGNAPRIKG